MQAFTPGLIRGSYDQLLELALVLMTQRIKSGAPQIKRGGDPGKRLRRDDSSILR
ncbi:MAG: hypothetical protein IT391_09210 [Nitrospira sp.]|nr:hypothetical protein [Nitrospira sp.]